MEVNLLTFILKESSNNYAHANDHGFTNMFIFVYNGFLNGHIKDKEIHLCKAKLVSRGIVFLNYA